MTPTKAEAQVLVEKLESALQGYERESGLRRVELSIRGIAPDGPQVGHELVLRPKTTGAALEEAERTIRGILAEFESETDVWVSAVEALWTREEPPRRLFECQFRGSY